MADERMRESLENLRIDRGGAGPARRRWWLVAIPLAMLAVAAAVWWSASARPKAVRAVSVREEKNTGAPAVLNASGYVTARRQATVSSKVTGKVVEVLVEEGMPVREGQVLARLDDSVERDILALAEARLEATRRAVGETEARLRLAELTLERTRRLVEDEVQGEADLDRAVADERALAAQLATAREQVEVAEREVALRRTGLADTVIRAPFDGVAVSKDAQPGEMVSPVSAGGGFTRTGISTIVDMSSLEIEVDVNESYINRVRPGQLVEATLDAYPDWRVACSVIAIIPAADRQKATVRVRVGFDALDPRILPDMGVKVAFLEDGTAKAGDTLTRIRIPGEALRKAGDRDTVFLVVGNRVERRAVRRGAADGEQIEILSGLTPGDKVVVEGPADLADGDRVVLREP